MQPNNKCIYVFSCGPHIKIGVTRNVSGRLKALQVGQAYPVRLECLWDVPVDTAHKAEAYAHRLLSKHKVRGEWFAATLDDVLEIEPLVFRRAHRCERFSPEGYEGADRFAAEILSQGRFLTLAERLCTRTPCLHKKSGGCTKSSARPCQAISAGKGRRDDNARSLMWRSPRQLTLNGISKAILRSRMLWISC